MACWPTLNFRTCTSASCEANGYWVLFFWSSFRSLLIQLQHVLKLQRISQSTHHMYKTKKKTFLIHTYFWKKKEWICLLSSDYPMSSSCISITKCSNLSLHLKEVWKIYPYFLGLSAVCVVSPFFFRLLKIESHRTQGLSPTFFRVRIQVLCVSQPLTGYGPHYPLTLASLLLLPCFVLAWPSAQVAADSSWISVCKISSYLDSSVIRKLTRLCTALFT